MRAKSVQEIVNRTKFSCSKRMAKNIICMFFKEAKKSIKQGKEVRLPGKKNGILSLVIKARGAKSLKSMQKIGTVTSKKVLRGSIKPMLVNFDIRNAAPHCLVKDFKLGYSYSRQLMNELSGFTDSQRALLMEIE